MTPAIDTVIELTFSLASAFFAVVMIISIAFTAQHDWKRANNRHRVGGILIVLLAIFVIVMAILHASLTVVRII